MRRATKIVLGVLALPLALLLAANTGPGQRLIADRVTALTGGQVVLAGLSGRFPDDLRLAHLELRDAAGAWLTADDVVLRWSPTALLRRTARVDMLSAAGISVARAPVAAAPARTPSQGGFSLPVHVELGAVQVARLRLGAGLAGTNAVLQLRGAAMLASLTQGSVTVMATRLDSPGDYAVTATVVGDAMTGRVAAHEPAGGLIANLARVPALGALDVTASVAGPRADERADVVATAGALRLRLAGAVDVPGQSAVLDLAVSAPAMRPAAGVAWQKIAVDAHIKGKWLAPQAQAHVALAGLQAGGAAIAGLTADVTGTRGQVGVSAVLTGARIPGPHPGLFAASPVDVTGGIDLQAAGRPAHFTVSHALLSVVGSAITDGAQSVSARLEVPALGPFGALANVAVQGRLSLGVRAARHGSATTVALDGTAVVAGGQAPVPALLGSTALSVAATMEGQDFTLSRLALNGRALRLEATGARHSGLLDMRGHVALPDLAALSPQARGALAATLHVSGPGDDLTAAADITGTAGSVQFPPAPVAVAVRASGLPGAPNADIDARGRLQGAPFVVLARAQTEAAGAVRVTLRKADWKSLSAAGELVRGRGAGVPVGKVEVRIGRLADFAGLAGTDMGGALHATFESRADAATVQLRGTDLAAGARRIGRLALDGKATGVTATPDLAGTMTLDDIEANGITGTARLTAAGRPAALRLDAGATLQNLHGAPATIAAEAVVNGPAKQVALARLAADWKTLALRLQGPARLDFADGITVDHLTLGLNQATLHVAGRLGPTLDVTAALRNVTPDLARAVAPTVSATGSLSADARLGGTPAAPLGRVHVVAAGLHARLGPAASLPPAGVSFTANLLGQSAQIDARIDAGARLHLQTAGTAPLRPAGALALRTTGQLDLSLLDPVLEAGGRRLTGRLALNLTTTGPATAPQAAGSVTLSRGELIDYVQGLHLTQMQARLDAAGDTLRITQFQARAGAGSIAASGSVGIFAPTMPVDLHITARNAKPLASDLLTALFDADIAVKGAATGAMDATGSVTLRRVDINIPDHLPPGVAVLNVRRPGQKPPPPAPPAPPAFVRLAIVVDAPRNIFVRGDGLDAELGGELTLGGTSLAPQVQGGFDLRRGYFSLAGTSLDFTKGRVSFDGTSVAGRIDPTIDFEADSVGSSITATLAITGYADQPKIALSSVPALPQDEVLAQLLFGTSVTKLSPLQIAEIGAALAELSGVAGTGGPLGSIRKGLGLDRLSVGGGTNGAGASVQAGRYVANGVYVGAKQSTGGAGGTQAQVQVDITRHLKLQTTLGTGGGTVQGATPDNDPGSSVGLSYQFEY